MKRNEQYKLDNEILEKKIKIFKSKIQKKKINYCSKISKERNSAFKYIYDQNSENLCSNEIKNISKSVAENELKEKNNENNMKNPNDHLKKMENCVQIKLKYFTAYEILDFFHNFKFNWKKNIFIQNKILIMNKDIIRLIKIFIGVIFSIIIWVFVTYYLIIFGIYYKEYNLEGWLSSFLYSILLDLTLNPLIKVNFIYFNIYNNKSKNFFEKIKILRNNYEIYALYK